MHIPPEPCSKRLSMPSLTEIIIWTEPRYKLICLKTGWRYHPQADFIEAKKIDKTYDLSGVISKRRNELIAGVLVACNVMESAGTGFDKITEEYASADKAHKPYIYSTSLH